MTPEEKNKRRESNKAEKIRRAKFHTMRRNQKYFDKISQAHGLGYSCPLHAVNSGYMQSWEDPKSPTGYSQRCSYQGICEYPCNGDC